MTRRYEDLMPSASSLILHPSSFTKENSMRNIGAVALLLVLWLIWSRLHIVLYVALPWWGLLLGAVGLFLVVQHLFMRIFTRRS
jgi:hypothetical protein